MSNCIFCKIANHEIPKDFEFEDDEMMAFPDITPKAPVHILIVPKEHVEDFFHAPEKLHMKISNTIKKIIDKFKLMDRGYRITINGGGAQDIDHLHFHLRGPIEKGRAL